MLVGDLVKLDTGHKIPADGIMFAGFNCKADEASLTGESEMVRKDPQGNAFLYSGCNIVEGTAMMYVTAVGPRSQWGIIKEHLSERNEEDTPLQATHKIHFPFVGLSLEQFGLLGLSRNSLYYIFHDGSLGLQEKLEEVADLIGKVGLGVAIACFVVLTISWIAAGNYQYKEFVEEGSWKALLDFLVIAVTIVAVAVPEGATLSTERFVWASVAFTDTTRMLN